MKKLLLIMLLLVAISLNAYKLIDFNRAEQDEIKEGIISDIYLEPWETIESVEGDKYDITDYTSEFWIVVTKDGTTLLVPKS
jgi:hypothetical protein